MSKVSFKGSLLATTVIAGMALATPALAQNQTVPETAPPAPVTPTDTQGNTPPAAPSAQTPPAGVQTSETAAPAEPTSAQEIVITGTLIRNPNLVASAPVTVVGHDEIQLRQTNTAEEILRTIPGAAPGAGAQVNNGQTGAAFVNLRSLGTNRNIVLLDGVRIVPADLIGRVDLNNIPLALVDRVDVLTGGASSTYGADAVAGVINFITRSDFAGMELSVSDQITQRGDGNTLRGDLTLGANFDDGRGNAVMSLGYIESDPVYQGGDRPDSQFSIDSRDPTNLALAGSSTTTPSAFDIGGGRRRQQVSPDGTGIQDFYKPFNFNPYNVFQVPFTRYNLFAAAHYDITDHLTVYGRGLFSDNTIDSIIAPSGLFGVSVNVPVSNPFLSVAQRDYFCANALINLPGGTQQRGITPAECAAAAAATSASDPAYRTFTVGLRRRTPEVGPRITHIPTHIFDFRAGLRGDITDKIGFDVFASRGISERSTNAIHFVSISAMRQALLATNPDTCLDPSNGCVPVNVFGAPGTITPEMASFLERPATFVTRSKLSQARATINGDTPLQLWAKNPVSFAIGAEYRKYKADQEPDQLSRTAGELGGAGGATSEIHGGLDVYEGFAEVIAPIVSDRPFFNELQLEAGIRRSHYTVATPSNPKFNTTTWKLAGSWAPVRDLKFRGAYNHAVRAPNIGELFAPPVTGLTNLGVDPCAGSAPVTNANLRAVCLAQGAPPGTIGSIGNPTAGQANITASGSLNLKPEVANTWTVGAILRPRFLSGLSASIDYYHIKVKGAVTAPTPGDLITACFGPNPTNPPPSAATNPACTVIRRNPISGQLDGDPADTPGLFASLTNQGKLATDGVDVTLDYRRPLGTLMGAPAKLNLNLGGNYTHSQKFQATPTSLNRECVGFYSANCGFPAGALLPKYSFNQRTTLSIGRVDLSMLWRYIHKMHFEPQQLADEAAAADAANRDASGNLLPLVDQGCPDFAGADPGGCMVDPAFRKIGARNYFDFTGRFNVNEHFTLTFTVFNLFDKKPPFVGNTVGTTSQNSGDTFPSTYDPLGRRFAASARIKF
jgi:iron complex outermembrane receptor protein